MVGISTRDARSRELPSATRKPLETAKPFTSLKVAEPHKPKVGDSTPPPATIAFCRNSLFRSPSSRQHGDDLGQIAGERHIQRCETRGLLFHAATDALRRSRSSASADPAELPSAVRACDTVETPLSFGIHGDADLPAVIASMATGPSAIIACAFAASSRHSVSAGMASS